MENHTTSYIPRSNKHLNMSGSSTSSSSPVQEVLQSGQDLSSGWDLPITTEADLGHVSEDLFSDTQEVLQSAQDLDSWGRDVSMTIEADHRHGSQDLFFTAPGSLSDTLEALQSGTDLSSGLDLSMNIENSPTQALSGSSTRSDLSLNLQEPHKDDGDESQDLYATTPLSLPVDLDATASLILPVDLDATALPVTQDEKIVSERNLFAYKFHGSNISSLMTYSGQKSLGKAVLEYVVFCSQMIEKYLAQRFPDDPKKRKELRNMIEETRDENFGIYCNKSEEPQAGPSGYKRPISESSTSPPKKKEKKESDDSDDVSD